MKGLKFSITVDVDDKGRIDVWSQSKEAMTDKDIDQKRVLEARIRVAIHQYQNPKDSPGILKADNY